MAMVISAGAYDKLASFKKLDFCSNPFGPQTTLNLVTLILLNPVCLDCNIIPTSGSHYYAMPTSVMVTPGFFKFYSRHVIPASGL